MAVDSKQIPIESPCPIKLDQTGVTEANRRMFCDHCVKNVHLLSHMTEREARDFLRDRQGENICVSYDVGVGGGIRFKSTAPLIPASRLRAPSRRASWVPAAASLGMLLVACAPHADIETVDLVEVVEQVRDIELIDVRTIPDDEPCDPRMQVDGGIRPVPIEEPVVAKPGGIMAHPIEDPPPAAEPPERHVRGRVKPSSL